jgi:hypothetical protein
MTQEELKMVLDALKESKTNNDTMEFHDRKNKAITAIEEALAQTQEPVVYQCPRCATSMQVDLTAKAALAQTQEPWCMKMNGCKTKCEDCPDEPPQRTEQNFCSRCGKRTADLTVIHTCTPPQENT